LEVARTPESTSEFLLSWMTWASIPQPGDRLATILVVDDEVSIRQALRRFIEVKKHSVLEAGDGIEALEVLSESDVDAAIVDLMMPRMDGLELLSRMRDEHANVRVIVISAREEILDLAERETAVVKKLKKPFELTEVAEALQSALGDF
jgi:CheY-like chemotaxis protein